MRSLSRSALCLVAGIGLLAACVLTASEPAKPAAAAVTDKEKKSLHALHHQAVDIFVDRPGFGIRRLVLNLDDIMTAPKSLAEAYADKDKLSPKDQKKPSHFAVADMLMEQCGRLATDDGKETWQLKKFHLVGLLKQAEPVVYLEDKDPKKRGEEPKPAKDIPTRALDTFEKAALKTLRGGEPLVAERSDKTMRVMAPIYAGKRCAACHEPGTLLGGFTYELERVAYDPAKDGPLRR